MLGLERLRRPQGRRDPIYNIYGPGSRRVRWPGGSHLRYGGKARVLRRNVRGWEGDNLDSSVDSRTLSMQWLVGNAGFCQEVSGSVVL